MKSTMKMYSAAVRTEVQVDLADVFADGDVDLFGTAVLCDNCSRKLMGGAACGCEQV